jgi:signal transduction histidine kinase
VSRPGAQSLGAQLVPVTAVCVAVAFAMLLLPATHRDWRELAIAAFVGAGVVVLALAWQRAPRLAGLGVPLAYLLLVSLLRDGAGGSISGFGGFALLPIIYLALFSGLAELLIGLGAMAAANVVPLVAVGSPAYPLPGWRGSLVQVGAAAIAGFTIQHLVGQARRQAARTIEQNARLRELDRLKDEFLALVSHELRTPLTSIIGYLDLAIEDSAASPTLPYLEAIERNVRRLSRLVDDLLFIAQIEAGRLSVSCAPFELQPLLREAADAARPIAERKNVEVALDVAPGALVTGDRSRMAQLVDNLVSNAVKFTPDGGRVAITARGRDDRMRVEVRDTGIGIPQNELPLLFNRFFRASTAQERELPGTGLGLAISQSIAEAHGTRIDVASEPGAGTTFGFELPLAHEPVASEAQTG